VTRAAALVPRAGAGYAAALAAALIGALLMGIAAGLYPIYAFALSATALVFLFAFRFPVAHLLVLLFVTAVIPLGVQSRFGGSGAIPSDVLLFAGLVRAAVKLPHLPIDRRTARVLVLCLGLFFAVAVQFVHAILLGRAMSGVGAEARVLLSIGTALIALPILAERDSRARLLRGLLWFGVALGLWGIAQFALQLRFDVQADTWAGSTDSFHTAGRVVGMYAFPLAALIALSVLASGAVRGTRTALALAAVVGLNLAAVVLTFERTFFIAFGAGLLVLLLRMSGRQRTRLTAWTLGLILTTVVGLSAVAPAVLNATADRLTSVKDYKSDPSVVYRQHESRLVTNRIKANPLAGSGLGATVLIGRPGTNQLVKPRRYAENGYLWLIWKLGVVGAAVLLALVAAAILCRPRARDPLDRAVVVGAQASLFALAVATFAFPSWNQLAITPAIGLLIALAVSRVDAHRTVDPGSTA
jgi:hypothetical protein